MCAWLYISNIKNYYTLEDEDTITTSVRSLLYVFILKIEDCYKLQ